MAINFPDSPSVNDTHTVGSRTWKWDGTVWNLVLTTAAYTTLVDADGDTKIQVEETADEDVIRFDVAGTEYVTIDNTGLVSIAQNAEVDGTLTANHIHGNLAGAVYLHVKNTSGSSIAAGSPVYATGSVGASGATEIAASDASTSSTMPALGIIQTTLANNAEGHATILGVIGSLDTSTYSLNQPLYVAPGGGLTATRPTAASDKVQSIARVVRVDGSTGELLVLGAGRTNDVPNEIEIAGDLTVDTDTLYVDSANDRVGVNTASPAVALDVVGTTDTDYLTVGGENVTPYTGRKNYLYNGAMQIFQRGGTVTTSSGYTLDGWRIEPVNTGYTAGINGSVTQVDDSGYAMSVRSSTTAPGFYMIEQRLEGKEVAHLAGRTVTFSFKVKRVDTGITSGTIRVNHDDDLSGSLRDETTIATVESNVSTISTSAYEQYSTTFTFPATVSATGYYRIGIYFHGLNGAGTSTELFRIKDVQLEEGNVQTPMEYRSYYDELRVCERYYQKGDLIPATSGAGYYQAAGSTNFGQINTVSLRTEMRVLPSMSWSFTNVDNASLASYLVSNRTVGLRVVAGSGSFPYFSYYASFTASAEI